MAHKTTDSEIDEIFICVTPESPRSGVNSPIRRSDIWNMSPYHVDELPIFSIRSIAPSSRSPSPIENVSITSIPEVDEPEPDDENDYDLKHDNASLAQRSRSDTELISLAEINAQIHTPVSYKPKRAVSLDTIFEGVFLETPPKKRDCNTHKMLSPRRRVRNSLSCLVLEEEQMQAV